MDSLDNRFTSRLHFQAGFTNLRVCLQPVWSFDCLCLLLSLTFFSAVCCSTCSSYFCEYNVITDNKLKSSFPLKNLCMGGGKKNRKCLQEGKKNKKHHLDQNRASCIPEYVFLNNAFTLWTDLQSKHVIHIPMLAGWHLSGCGCTFLTSS